MPHTHTTPVMPVVNGATKQVKTNNTKISSPSFSVQSYLIFRDYHPSVVQNIVLLQLKVLGYKIVAHPTPAILVVNGTTRQRKLTPERNFKFRNLNVQTEAVQSLPCCRLFCPRSNVLDDLVVVEPEEAFVTILHCVRTCRCKTVQLITLICSWILSLGILLCETLYSKGETLTIVHLLSKTQQYYNSKS